MTDQPALSAAHSPPDRPGDRAALRRAMIAARLALPAEEHRAASAAIVRRLLALLQPMSPGRVAFCWPIRAEVDCRPVVAALLAAGWQAAMPVVDCLAAPLAFRVWQPDAPMTADPYGIPIPDTLPAPPPDVLLIPLVGFDSAGYRLGYGGGYFDRTLAALHPRPITIGVGFELGMTERLHPAAHDIPLDIIVTEVGVRRVHGAVHL